MMRFLFDGNIVDAPRNWQEVSTTIKRDNQLNLFLLYQEYNLEFGGSGYAYLSNMFTTQSFCNEITVQIQVACGNAWQEIFNGLIFLTDCEFNERAYIVNCKVNDKSFFSKINNNKSIRTTLDAKLTKNKQQITVIEQYLLDVRKVLDGTLIRTVNACRVEEAFRYFIEFMTDGSIGFVSDTFGSAGQWAGLCLTTGERLRGVTVSGNTGRWLPFNFTELFDEINKRIPIVLLVENPYTSPVVRIESLEYLYNSSVTFTVPDAYEIDSSYDTDKLYALVKFGSPTDDTNSLDFPEDIDYFGFKTEEFHLLTTCNLDQTLDLSSDWVVSSNVIQQVAQTGSQDWDSSIFLIISNYTDDFTGETTNSNFLNSTPPRYHYNELLTNKEISERYLPEISSSIASFFINSQEGEALAYRTTNIAHTVGTAIEDFTAFLDIESYDFGNYYNTGTRRYVAQQPATYTFEAQVVITCGAATGQGANYYRFIIEHYNAAGTLLGYYNIHNVNASFLGVGYLLLGPAPGTTVTKTLSATTVSMVTGDYLTMRIQSWPYTNSSPGSGAILGTQLYNVISGNINTWLKIVETSITGGTFLSADPNDIKVQIHKFSYPMTQGQFDTVLANPVGKIAFKMRDQQYRFGWIKELKYNHTSAQADFTLITSKQSQNGN